jgi:hypothetical protein
MEPERQEEYKGHRIELRAPQALRALDAEQLQEELELLIDDSPVRYGQLPDGRYFLHEYAYDWRDDLVALAQGFIDHQGRAEEIRRGGREPGRGE